MKPHRPLLSISKIPPFFSLFPQPSITFQTDSPLFSKGHHSPDKTITTSAAPQTRAHKFVCTRTFDLDSIHRNSAKKMLNFDIATPEGAEANSAAAVSMNAPKAGGGNIVYVVVQPTATEDSEHFRKTFPAKIVTKVAALQILIFVVAIIIEVTHLRTFIVVSFQKYFFFKLKNSNQILFQ